MERIEYKENPEIFLMSKGTILSVKSGDKIKETNPKDKIKPTKQ